MSSTPHKIATCPKIAPIKLPKISKGKKIPPGAPEPKLSNEKINLTINKIINVLKRKTFWKRRF